MCVRGALTTCQLCSTVVGGGLGSPCTEEEENVEAQRVQAAFQRLKGLQPLGWVELAGP